MSNNIVREIRCEEDFETYVIKPSNVPLKVLLYLCDDVNSTERDILNQTIWNYGILRICIMQNDLNQDIANIKYRFVLTQVPSYSVFRYEQIIAQKTETLSENEIYQWLQYEL